MSDIKTVNISRDAAASISGGVVKKQRRSTKKNQEGGAAEEQVRGVSSVMNVIKGVESTSSIAATAAAPNSNTWLKYPAGAPVPPPANLVPQPSYIPSSPDKAAAPIQHGGTKHIKVELKKKPTVKKVHLNPKKVDAQKSTKKAQTRKVRKVTLGVSSLHKRITRAKKLHKKMKEMPIEELKQKLIKGGLIKATSKAPESVLRQLAADAEVVKNKAL